MSRPSPLSPGHRTKVAIACVAALSLGAGVADGARSVVITRDPAFVPKDAAAAKRIARDDAALAILNRAQRRVRARRPSCRPPKSVFPTKPTFDDGNPSAAALAALAPLRRPAGPADQRFADALATSRFPEIAGIYQRYVRVVHAANGTAFAMFIARSTGVFWREPDACLDADHAELQRLLVHQPADVAHAARRFFAQMRKEVGRQDAGPREGIYLFTLTAAGGLSGGGGGEDAARFVRHGLFGSSGTANGSHLGGLVPDGVATVTFRFPRTVSLGPNFRPKVFPSAFTRTVHVRENVVGLRVPRPAEFAFNARMVWRDAAGKIVRTVHTP